jgi:hypothetical protein
MNKQSVSTHDAPFGHMLSWFRANLCLLLILNVACIGEKQQILILLSLVSPKMRSNQRFSAPPLRKECLFNSPKTFHIINLIHFVPLQNMLSFYLVSYYGHSHFNKTTKELHPKLNLTWWMLAIYSLPALFIKTCSPCSFKSVCFLLSVRSIKSTFYSWIRPRLYFERTRTTRFNKQCR